MGVSGREFVKSMFKHNGLGSCFDFLIFVRPGSILRFHRLFSLGGNYFCLLLCFSSLVSLGCLDLSATPLSFVQVCCADDGWALDAVAERLQPWNSCFCVSSSERSEVPMARSSQVAWTDRKALPGYSGGFFSPLFHSITDHLLPVPRIHLLITVWRNQVWLSVMLLLWTYREPLLEGLSRVLLKAPLSGLAPPTSAAGFGEVEAEGQLAQRWVAAAKVYVPVQMVTYSLPFPLQLPWLIVAGSALMKSQGGRSEGFLPELQVIWEEFGECVRRGPPVFAHLFD